MFQQDKMVQDETIRHSEPRQRRTGPRLRRDRDVEHFLSETISRRDISMSQARQSRDRDDVETETTSLQIS